VGDKETGTRQGVRIRRIRHNDIKIYDKFWREFEILFLLTFKEMQL
jgi:hypothetical protein